METIADFEIQYSQFLDPDGKPTADVPALATDSDKLIQMYALMTETRVFDAKAVNLQRTGKLGTYASCLGHEATHVGIAAAMRPDDVLAPSYREIGSMLYRGVTMAEIPNQRRVAYDEHFVLDNQLMLEWYPQRDLLYNRPKYH